MANTYALRKVIVPHLKRIEGLEGRVYYRRAPAEELYPYCVYNLKSLNDNEYPAENWILHVEIYDKNITSDRLDEIADQIMNQMDFLNEPTEEILPTIYFMNRDHTEDKDKGLQIWDLRFEVNNYEVKR